MCHSVATAERSYTDGRVAHCLRMHRAMKAVINGAASVHSNPDDDDVDDDVDNDVDDDIGDDILEIVAPELIENDLILTDAELSSIEGML